MTQLLMFVGMDGSLGLHTHRKYVVTIAKNSRGGITADIVDPFTEQRTRCPYGSLAAFWRNWREDA